MCILSRLWSPWSWWVRRHPRGKSYPSIYHRLLSVQFLHLWWICITLASPSLTCLSTKRFWADSQIHLGSPARRANLYLRKGWRRGSQSTVCWFLKLKLSGSRRPWYLKGNQTMPLSPKGAALSCRNCTLSLSWKPRCHGEMLAVKVLANQHWFAHNRLSCIGGSVGDYLPKGNSSKTQASWKDVLLLWHAKSHSSTARHLSPQSCSATAFEEGEARHSIHGCGLNTRMVRCRRLTQCSDRKKRHVRHVHSRLNLARQFATLRACFQKEFFIDEKVRFNRVQKQGSCVQIISGVQYKPDQARHKWNQLNVVTDALLDVALSASSTFMLPMPLIEEGVATCASPWQTLAEFFLCKSLELSLCTWEGIPRSTGPTGTRWTAFLLLFVISTRHGMPGMHDAERRPADCVDTP